MIPLNDTIAQRSATIAGLATHLRTTHLGVEPAIDRLLEAVRPWFLVAQAQSRPRVVGLWGMTGTGKSSLVRAMVKHLGVEDRTYWLDAGECQRHNWLDPTMERIRSQHDGAPFVLVVDEFQHARTVQGGVEAEEAAELRRLWELMDCGRAWVDPGYGFRFNIVLDLEAEVRGMLQRGVVIRGGKVTRGLAVYREVVAARRDAKRTAVPWAIPESLWDDVRGEFPTPVSLWEFRQRLEELDGPGVLRMLHELLSHALVPVPLDGSKALVLVLGNLNELYASGREPIPELDPEVLLARHRTLSNTGIQQALLNMFRIEQVARLGSDHIVFPPMGRVAVDGLVAKEAASLAERLAEVAGLPLTVAPALLARIQREASVAVLGARPLVAAVASVIPALYTQVLARIDSSAGVRCTLDAVEGQVIARIEDGGHVSIVPLQWPLAGPPELDQEALRRTALHEAGHVICGTLLGGRKALQACARTSHERIGGFVIWDRTENPVFTRANVVSHLAVLLGGWAAERVVYGAEGVSSGCVDDLQRATNLALGLIKEHGLGAERLFHADHATALSPGFRTRLVEVEAQAEEWIRQAEALALRTVSAEQATLEALTAALMEHGSLGPEAIMAFFRGDAHLVHENLA